jgi:putative membrane protein
MQSQPPQVLALVASSTCVLAVGALLAGFLEFGPHARHMAAHILAMNVAAPVLAAVALARWKRPMGSVSLLWFATFVQIAVLWAWHAPIAQNLILQAPSAMIVAHAALLMAATAFWASLLSLTGSSRWQAIPALLLTGKLVCLLAACPLSYLVAAVIITVHLIGADEPPRPVPPIHRTAS